jgi:hypothetical protein
MESRGVSGDSTAKGTIDAKSEAVIGLTVATSSSDLTTLFADHLSPPWAKMMHVT